VLYAEDLIRFVRKPRWKIKDKAKFIVMFSRYTSATDAMDSAVDKSFESIAAWCEERGITLQNRELTGEDSVKGFFEAICEADIVHIFCHGEHGTSPLQQQLRFNDISITLADLYENKNAIAGKAFCLCACRSGSDSSQALSEHISFATVLAALGALLVYAPLESPFVRDLPMRTKDFLDILEGKPVQYPAGWRVMV
jgi:CHAT domain-containing protein